MEKTNLLIVDPQNDFCDSKGSLFVPGAEEDMQRMAKFIRENCYDIECIVVTLDQHNKIHIGHPGYWGVPPFTTINLSDQACETMFANHSEMAHNYLEIVGTHMVWPEHCMIGEWGSDVHPVLRSALRAYESSTGIPVAYLRKGEYIHSEQFSAFDYATGDPHTINITTMNALGRIYPNRWLVGGEAMSHCVLSTCKGMLKNCDISIDKINVVRQWGSWIGEADWNLFLDIKGLKVMEAPDAQ